MLGLRPKGVKMSKGPEGTFKNKIKKRLFEVGIHTDFLSGVYTNGLPDAYHEGSARVCFVEYKWKSPSPTKLQERWLARASSNNVFTFLVCGYPDGSIFIERYRGDPAVNSTQRGMFSSTNAYISFLTMLLNTNSTIYSLGDTT